MSERRYTHKKSTLTEDITQIRTQSNLGILIRAESKLREKIKNLQKRKKTGAGHGEADGGVINSFATIRELKDFVSCHKHFATHSRQFATFATIRDTFATIRDKFATIRDTFATICHQFLFSCFATGFKKYLATDEIFDETGSLFF